MEATGSKPLKWYDRGDPVGEDFGEGDLTADEAFHDLDLSSIVPVGTKAVKFRWQIMCGFTNQYLAIRKKGNVGAMNLFQAKTQEANVANMGDGEVYVNTDRKAEYKLSNVAWTHIRIVIASYGK